MDRSTARGWLILGVLFVGIALGCATAPMRMGDIRVRNTTASDAEVVLEIKGKMRRRFEVTLPPGGEVEERGWMCKGGDDLAITVWRAELWGRADRVKLDAFERGPFLRNSVPFFFEIREERDRLRLVPIPVEGAGR